MKRHFSVILVCVATTAHSAPTKPPATDVSKATFVRMPAPAKMVKTIAHKDGSTKANFIATKNLIDATAVNSTAVNSTAMATPSVQDTRLSNDLNAPTPIYLDTPIISDPVNNAINDSINDAQFHPSMKPSNRVEPVIISRPVIAAMDNTNRPVEMATYELGTLTDNHTNIAISNAYPVAVPSTLSLAQAQQVLTQVSPKLAANIEAISASELRSQASEGLNNPIISLRAQAQRYKLDSDVDLTSLKTGISDGLGNLGSVPNIPTIPNIPNILPDALDRIPDDYEIEREGSNIGANLTVLWPVYTAGRTQALTGVLNARTDEARADALMDSDTLYTTLVERYFTAQLAIIGAYLREDALHTTEETVYMAKRLWEEGFIADVEYLEARVALSEAQSEAIKARHDANLAMTALQRLLRTPYPIKPTTPLFVSSQPLPDLSYFQTIAIDNHPGLEKVDAKYEQAQQLQKLSKTGLKPTVSVYGLHQIDTDASWLVGMSASWKLWGGVDSRIQLAAGDAQMRQALLTKIDVTDNIKLLVEKNWQAVENARIRYLALNSNVTLAEELLRYKQLGLAEGMNTALDVTTAQTQYLKARTEQAVVANDYVQALADLMESCGTPFAFNDYMATADIRLPQLY